MIGKKRLVVRKPWIMAEIIELIDKRRSLKNKSDEESQKRYKRSSNSIYKKCKQAKEKMIQEKCEQIEENMKKGKIVLAERLVAKALF